MSKVLSIIIPIFNKFNFTKACLNDLSKLPEDHEIIIVDNGSSDETQVEVEKLLKTSELQNKLVYKRNEINLGFAKACNIGYAMATAPNVLFLNNDIRVKSHFEDWTRELIKLSPKGMVGPTMGQLDKDLNFIQEANRVLQGNSYMSGWCLSSSKEIWESLKINNYVGPFSEEFGLAYFEDTDLSFRARRQKLDFFVVEIPVVHFGKQTSAQLNVRALYHQARQIFVKKWGK